MTRLGGPRFLLLLPDVDIPVVTGLVERLRQAIELMRFQYQEFEIRITASCGVAPALPEDTPDAIFGRLEHAVGEAKRYGSNRTFLHEGKYPTPVIAPSFPLSERTITL
jgi:PleD family two-component response regulator